MKPVIWKMTAFDIKTKNKIMCPPFSSRGQGDNLYITTSKLFLVVPTMITVPYEQLTTVQIRQKSGRINLKNGFFLFLRRSELSQFFYSHEQTIMTDRDN